MRDEPVEIPGDYRQEGAGDELNVTLELRSDSSSESIDVGDEVELATKSRGLLSRSRDELLIMPPVPNLSGRKRPARPRCSPPKRIRRQDIGKRPPLTNYMHRKAPEKNWRESNLFGVFSGKRRTEPAFVETSDSEFFDFSLWQRMRDKKLQEGFEGQEGPEVPEVKRHAKQWRCSSTTLSPMEGKDQQQDHSSCVVQ